MVSDRKDLNSTTKRQVEEQKQAEKQRQPEEQKQIKRQQNKGHKANELDESTSEFNNEFDESSESNKSNCLYQLYSKN